eukprot:GHVP01053612.1.p1 GENE.GHVP01053612.1~~GHVP01053612.1.p1  ORF type:complete len:393 (-),score=46.08 GHVP01053612.1:33-1211(-)
MNLLPSVFYQLGDLFISRTGGGILIGEIRPDYINISANDGVSILKTGDAFLSGGGLEYKASDSFINIMREAGAPIKTVKRIDIKNGLQKPVIIRKGCSISLGTYKTTLPDLLILSCLGRLVEGIVDIKNLGVSGVGILISSEEVQQGLNFIFSGRLKISGISGLKYHIESPLLVPYLSRISFPENCRFLIDLDIDHEAAEGIELLNFGRLSQLSLLNKAFHLLPKIKFPKDHKVDLLLINPNESEINQSTIRDILALNIRSVGNLRLHGRAFHLLSKITMSGENKIDALYVDTKNSNIDDMKKMAHINISSVNNLILKRRATYLLPLMKFSANHSVRLLALYSDSKNCPSHSEIRVSLNGLTKSIKVVVLSRNLISRKKCFPHSTRVYVSRF